MSGRRFGIATILLILIIIFCVKGTVMSKGNPQRAQENIYYLGLEQEYVANMKAYLQERGFADCGVMMTRVTYEDGSREYKIQIHHRRIEGMSAADKLFLQEALMQKEFGRDACVFQYDL